MRVMMIWLCSITLLINMPACREGCTNADALNYDSKAKSDDGSCMYCDTAYTKVVETAPWPIRDPDPSSSMFDEYVLEATATNYMLSIKGNACGAAATSVQDSCHRFQHMYKLKNTTQRDISIQGRYTLRYSDNGFILSEQKAFAAITVPAGQTIETDKVFELCLSNFARVRAASFGAEISAYTISYK